MYGELSGSAARLLLVYRDKNVFRLKKETIMKRAGIGADRVFYSARKELELKGFIKLTRVSGLPSTVELLSIGMSDQRERLTTEEEIKIDIDTLFERYQHNNNLINILYYYINRENSSNIHHLDDVCGDEKLCNLIPTGQGSYDSQVSTSTNGSIPTGTTVLMGGDSQVLGHSTPDSYVPTGSDLQVPTPSTPEYPVLLGHDSQVPSNKVDWQRVQGIWKTTFPYAHTLKKTQMEALLGPVSNDVDLFQSELNRIKPFADKKCQPNSPYSYVKKALENAFNGSGVQGKPGLKDGGKYNETSSENTPLKPYTHSSVDKPQELVYNTRQETDILEEPSPEFLEKLRKAQETADRWIQERGLPE